MAEPQTPPAQPATPKPDDASSAAANNEPKMQSIHEIMERLQRGLSDISDVNWAATLQGMPPATVNREIAIELALNNYLQFQLFKTALQTGTINATQLAQTAEHGFSPTVQMPTPSIASGN